MSIDGYTTVGFRTWSTNSVKHGNDVGVFLSHKIHHRTAHDINKPEIPDPYRYKHQADRSAEIDAVGFKGIGIKHSNISKLYN